MAEAAGSKARIVANLIAMQTTEIPLGWLLPMQGTAADLIKMSMIAVQNWLEASKVGTRMIMQVHDELVVDAVTSELEEVKALLVRCMERAVKLDVPLDVEVSHGQTWLEAH